ncbi:MAG: hypothetical protein A2896_00495 [Candidatus Nealsonbacteria bacterium RIFCSPLOWO2_01_FULL_43_32]|uniref:DUF1573 domain-containing protein n=1 Tax=Candidatus Nealsonbacteria bacterium RIFCSPLOWO2_01_FULL_43_32 TaxID=1801672 RepID=A0A1G2EFL1_9BACT|nr:MAG: hypothetical protein A2896_00495 [Candidatus Nealsonbacteria bacterium RIFCSPLOWO2_01_FULL_43_32]
MNIKKIVLILAVLGLAIGAGFIFKDEILSLVKPVSAEEIYPMFFCPCCGQPLDKNNICCAQAQERIDYIDSLTAQNLNLSEKEIILTYIKKYGLNAFIDQDKQAEAKAWLAASAPQERPIIGLSSSFYDFGDVSEAKGVIATLFELKNEGKKDLIINKLDSSCGCTSASIISKGEEGPRYAMAGHGIESPLAWEVAIAPGESAQLKVYYDPSVHQDFRGPATREISIFSNDPIDFEKKVVIELNQVN